MKIAGMELPTISDKEELTPKRITKKMRQNESLSASDSGLGVNPHMPPSMAKYFN